MIDSIRQKYLDHFGIKMHDFVPVEVNDTVAVGTSEKNALLEAIYRRDPRTKLPTGDIACYISSNTSPEVKKFIMDNIMLDTSSAALPTVPDGIDDDTAFALTRQAGESLDKYMNRLNEYTNEQVKLRDMLAENAKTATSGTSTE